MKTLLVDCYLRDSEPKMKFYREMCGAHSEIFEVKLADWNPGFNLTGFDAVVLSGSQWMISEDEPDEELKGFIRKIKIPTLGICFGHQLLACSFGAVVKRGEGFIERDETIEIVQDWEIFNGFDGKVVMRESHQEYVTPESIKEIGWQIGAVSSSCPVEAIRHPDLPLYGVQFHPERSGVSGKRLYANFYRFILYKGTK
ncbi:MAG: gamma-glutamyl-gamma-aminobutyrate hydrolase family protein [candidate division WOR-3 bacterium]